MATRRRLDGVIDYAAAIGIYCLISKELPWSQSSSNKLPSDDLPKIAHRAALSAKNLMIINDNSKVRT
jgi:hypothetical protein